MMPTIPFAGQSQRDGENIAANPTRLINFYRELGGNGYVLRSVLGMGLFADLGVSMMRDLRVIDGKMYAIAGGKFFRIEASGAVIELGDFPNTLQSGMAGNFGKISVVGGGEHFVWDGTTFAPVSVNFVPASVDYLGGYTLVTEKDGRRLAWSQLGDTAIWPGLNFATAETTDEKITRVVVLNDTAFVFKPNSLERWTVTGLAGASAMARIGGGDADVGLAGYALLTRFPGGMAWVGSNGRVIVWRGGLTAISTPPVEASIKTDMPVGMFYYEQRGHAFICLAFGNRPAWCFDVATEEWHERAEGEQGAWSARQAVKLGADWYVGADTGRVAKLGELRRDFGFPLIRRAVSRAVQTGQPFTLASVELFGRVGMDDEAPISFTAMTDDGSVLVEGPQTPILGEVGWDSGPAQVGLRLSRDGMTWGRRRMRDVGAVGEYETRLTWKALGDFRRVNLEVSVSSYKELPLNAECEVMLA